MQEACPCHQRLKEELAVSNAGEKKTDDNWAVKKSITTASISFGKSWEVDTSEV